MIVVVGIGILAAVSDLRSGRIPNQLIAAGLIMGLIFQIVDKRLCGVLIYAGGAGVPILVFGLLYYLRMIGAGDIKLLCAIGGFTGPIGCLICIFMALFWGGLLALGFMLYRRNLVCRMEVFFRYISQYGKGTREPYMKYAGTDAKFCFSIPVLLGILCYVGGIF